MLIRIVKMGFEESFIPTFLKNFEVYKEKIRHFKGCSHLELLRSDDDPTVFFTYSHWTDDQALQAYRNSKTFKEVWAMTKPGFNKKPEAWSVNRVVKLP